MTAKMKRFGFNTSFLPVPLPFSTVTSRQALQFPPHVHRSHILQRENVED